MVRESPRVICHRLIATAYVTDPAQFRDTVMDGTRKFNAMIAAAEVR